MQRTILVVAVVIFVLAGVMAFLGWQSKQPPAKPSPALSQTAPQAQSAPTAAPAQPTRPTLPTPPSASPAPTGEAALVQGSSSDQETLAQVKAELAEVRAKLATLQEQKIETAQKQLAEVIRFSDEIRFDPGQVSLNETNKKKLDKLAAQVKARKGTRVVVEGHTDDADLTSLNKEKYADNLGLSLVRATEVARYLAKVGVGVERISVSGYGQHRPVASNDNPQGQAMNRRVVIKLLPEEK